MLPGGIVRRGVVGSGAWVVGAAVGGGTVGGTVGATEIGGLVVAVPPPPTVVTVGDLTVVGVGLPPTFFFDGVSLPLTLRPESLLNDVPRQSPCGSGAWPITPAIVEASTARPSLVRTA